MGRRIAARSVSAQSPVPVAVAATPIEELEGIALGSLDLVVRQLDDYLRSVAADDVEPATPVMAANDQIARRTREVYSGVLRLMGAPGGAVALRRSAGLLHMTGCVSRMGNECVTIAGLASAATTDSSRDPKLFETIDRLARFTRSQLLLAQETFASRNIALADELVVRSSELDHLHRELFLRTIDIDHQQPDTELVVFVNLLAGCLERIIEEAVGIAEQAVYVTHGLFCELAGGLPAPARTAA